MSKSTFTLISDDLGGTFSDTQVASGMGCSGGNISPHLKWINPPEGTKSYAITMHDPDAPTDSGFWHWAVFNVPGDITEIQSGAGDPAKGLLPEGAFMGKADTGEHAYGGPCPPEGDFTHRYIISVYALKTKKVDFDENIPLAQAVFTLVTEYELARASLIVYYKR